MQAKITAPAGTIMTGEYYINVLNKELSDTYNVSAESSGQSVRCVQTIEAE